MCPAWPSAWPSCTMIPSRSRIVTSPQWTRLPRTARTLSAWSSAMASSRMCWLPGWITSRLAQRNRSRSPGCLRKKWNALVARITSTAGDCLRPRALWRIHRTPNTASPAGRGRAVSRCILRPRCSWPWVGKARSTARSLSRPRSPTPIPNAATAASGGCNITPAVRSATLATACTARAVAAN